MLNRLKNWASVYGKWILLGGFSATIIACGGSQQDSSGDAVPEISLSPLGVQLDGLNANLDITGMGRYTLAVASDNSATVSVPGIPSGWYTFTATYEKDGAVVARLTKLVEVTAGQNTAVSFVPLELDHNFDDDSDGWVNLAELIWGTDPAFAPSIPPSELPEFTQNVAGGEMLSTTYDLQFAVGDSIEAGLNYSNNYSMAGGFAAF
ncbi:MAG: hypothetical protein ACE5EH_06605 [Gammaproteobacteria bacterium]